MPPRFHDNKRIQQFGFGVQIENVFQLSVNGGNLGGQYSELYDSAAQPGHENKSAEITVARGKDSPLRLGSAKQVGVVRTRHANLSRSNNVVPQFLEKPNRGCIDILIG